MGTLRSIAVLSAALATAFPGIALSQASPQSVSSGTTIAQQFPTNGTNNNGINNNGTLNNGNGINNNGSLNNNNGVNNNGSLNNNNGINNNGSLNNNNGVNNNGSLNNNNGVNNNGINNTGPSNGGNNGTNNGGAVAPGSLLTQPQGTSGTIISPGAITYPSGVNTGGTGTNGGVNTQGTGTGVNQGTPAPGTIQVLPGSNPQIIQVVPNSNPQASLPSLPYNATGTLDAELLRATCNQNWQGAMNVVSRAIAASPNNAAYRAQLYQYRSRLQTLRDANVQVPNWSAQCTGS